MRTISYFAEYADCFANIFLFFGSFIKSALSAKKIKYYVKQRWSCVPGTFPGIPGMEDKIDKPGEIVVILRVLRYLHTRNIFSITRQKNRQKFESPGEIVVILRVLRYLHSRKIFAITRLHTRKRTRNATPTLM